MGVVIVTAAGVLDMVATNTSRATFEEGEEACHLYHLQLFVTEVAGWLNNLDKQFDLFAKPKSHGQIRNSMVWPKRSYKQQCNDI